jgi:O-antigen ligase
MATIRRGASDEAIRFMFGYLLSGFFVIAALSLRPVKIARGFLLNTTSILIGIMGLIAASQMMFGWKFEGVKIAEQIKRAQGFYSHPLTFAYAALVLMPWCFARVLAKPRQWQSWTCAGGMSFILIATQSVTVLCVSMLAIGFLMSKLLNRKLFIAAMISGVFLMGLTISIPNPLQQKFNMVISGQRADHETPYPDDRMAFWHANWEMIKDAPWLGRGTGLESSDRRPYYERLGLGHLKRMYEAHNMYLQAGVEGGIVSSFALLAFLAWWFIRLRANLLTDRWHRLAMMTTPVAFALGGLTQNAIQDSEVRFTLLLMCAISLWFSKDQPAKSS